MDKKISNWLKIYLEEANMDCFVIGISGGIDSALVSTLCAQTGKKTIVVSMPIHQATDQLKRAHTHIDWLKSNYANVISFTKDLSVLFDNFKSLFGTPEHKLALANSRSRLRMVTLYQLAGMNKGLVVGTGNKVEDFGVGFFTKYGDGGVDISPIGDLTKTEVRVMARELGIIEDILVAKPTDGLWDDDRTDEDQMGATYEELEWAMNFQGNPEELVGRMEKVYYIYKTLNEQNKHKMVEIPLFKKNKK
jgi:NAD+ synthase